MNEQPSAATNVLAIGDVGRPTYHVGDEAMMDVALLELAARGPVAVTVVNTWPVTPTLGEQGPVMVALDVFDPRPGATFDELRDQQLTELLARHPVDERADAFLRAVDAADAVLICGGGNLSASWPHLLYLRVAAAHLAAQRGIPLVVVGQTVGPALTPRQSRHLAGMLAGARFVGVRDEASFRLAQQLSPQVRVHLQVDDAAMLPGRPPSCELPTRFVAFAAHPWGDPADLAFPERLAALVSDLNATAEATVVWFPNTGSLHGPHDAGTDAELAQQVAQRIGDQAVLRVAPVLPSAELVGALHAAEVVVSARFHPVVMALAGGTPALALSADHYITVKLDGALRHAGLDGWRLPLATLGSPAPRALFAELWARRAEVAHHLATVTTGWQAAHTDRWDHVWASLHDADHTSISRATGAGPTRLAPTSVDTASIHAVGDTLERLLDEALTRGDVAEQYARSLEATLAAARQQTAATEQYVRSLETTLTATREQAETAVRSNSELHREVDRLHQVIADANAGRR